MDKEFKFGDEVMWLEPHETVNRNIYYKIFQGVIVSHNVYLNQFEIKVKGRIPLTKRDSNSIYKFDHKIYGEAVILQNKLLKLDEETHDIENKMVELLKSMRN